MFLKPAKHWSIHDQTLCWRMSKLWISEHPFFSNKITRLGSINIIWVALSCIGSAAFAKIRDYLSDVYIYIDCDSYKPYHQCNRRHRLTWLEEHPHCVAILCVVWWVHKDHRHPTSPKGYVVSAGHGCLLKLSWGLWGCQGGRLCSFKPTRSQA